MQTQRLTAATPSLDIGYEQTGPDTGAPIVLLHGFPYDVRQFDGVRDRLASPERRIIVPYLRGYGPTRYRSPDVFRSGQQAAVGRDAIDLLDALSVERALFAGYDWGGRAACVAAALWPDRVRGLVSAGGYAIQDIERAATQVAPPAQEYARWYVSYLNTSRGARGLEENRRDFCRFLWQLWSPTWRFSEDEYQRTAASFDHPDFVATVLHSYRHRVANAAGDPALESFERQLAAQPTITVPTIALPGGADGLEPTSSTDGHERHFSGPYQRRIVPGAGHCVPAEAPAAMAGAIESLLSTSHPAPRAPETTRSNSSARAP